MKKLLLTSVMLCCVLLSSVYAEQLVAGKDGALISEIFEVTRQFHEWRAEGYQDSFLHALKAYTSGGAAVILPPGTVVDHVSSLSDTVYIAIKIPGSPELRYSTRYYFE